MRSFFQGMIAVFGLLFLAIIISAGVNSVVGEEDLSSFDLKGRALATLSETVYQRGNPIKQIDTLAIAIRRNTKSETYLISCVSSVDNPRVCLPLDWLGPQCSRRNQHWSTSIDSSLPDPSSQPYSVVDMYHCERPADGQCVTATVHLIPTAPGLEIESYKPAVRCKS